MEHVKDTDTGAAPGPACQNLRGKGPGICVLQARGDSDVCYDLRSSGPTYIFKRSPGCLVENRLWGRQNGGRESSWDLGKRSRWLDQGGCDGGGEW